MNEVLLSLSNISAGYGQNTVLKDISLKIYEKDYLGVVGPNGGGKTTLLKVILGLIKPFSGEIVFCDERVMRKIGYMPQINTIDKKFPITVQEVIESGLMTEKDCSKPERKEKVEYTISNMGLAQLKNRSIGELSGGQLQRVFLGRAIINDPRLLILDEPNSYVDKRFEMHFYDLLNEINSQTAIVLVSHDIGTIISNMKNIACVDETLHYHAGAEVDIHWLEEHMGCPFEVLGHGEIPHRILKKH